MATTIINGIENRIIDGECWDWMDKRVDATLKGDAWYATAHKALQYLRHNPVRCEVNPDGSYTVVIPSKSEPGREYVATPDTCECRGHLGKTGRCYHRMVARLLEAADRYEVRRARHRAEMAKRVARQVVGPDGSIRWAASYAGTFVGLAESEGEAQAAIVAWLEQRAWLEAAQAQVAA